MRLVSIGAFVLFMAAAPIWGSEEGRDAKVPSSILENDPDQGFRLSIPAISRLGIQFATLKEKGPWIVPKTALIEIKRSTGIYRRWNGFITLVLLEKVRTEGEFVYVQSEDLRIGDEIVVVGGGFLRLVELDLSGGGDSCGG